MANESEPRALGAALAAPAFVTRGHGVAMHSANRHVERWAPEVGTGQLRSMHALGFVDRLVSPWIDTAQRSASLRLFQQYASSGAAERAGNHVSWVFPRPWYQDELDWMTAARQVSVQADAQRQAAPNLLTTRGTYVAPASLPSAARPASAANQPSAASASTAAPRVAMPAALYEFVAPSLSIAATRPAPVAGVGFGGDTLSREAYSPLIPLAAVHAAELMTRTVAPLIARSAAAIMAAPTTASGDPGGLAGVDLPGASARGGGARGGGALAPGAAPTGGLPAAVTPGLRSVLASILARAASAHGEVPTSRLAGLAPAMVTPPAPRPEAAAAEPVAQPGDPLLAAQVAEQYAAQRARVAELQRIAQQAAQRELAARAVAQAAPAASQASPAELRAAAERAEAAQRERAAGSAAESRAAVERASAAQRERAAAATVEVRAAVERAEAAQRERAVTELRTAVERTEAAQRERATATAEVRAAAERAEAAQRERIAAATAEAVQRERTEAAQREGAAAVEARAAAEAAQREGAAARVAGEAAQREAAARAMSEAAQRDGVAAAEARAAGEAAQREGAAAEARAAGEAAQRDRGFAAAAELRASGERGETAQRERAAEAARAEARRSSEAMTAAATERAWIEARVAQRVADRAQEQRLHGQARADAAADARAALHAPEGAPTTTDAAVRVPAAQTSVELAAAIASLPAELAALVGPVVAQHPERAMQVIGELHDMLRAVELLARASAAGTTFETTRGPRLVMPAGLGGLVRAVDRAQSIADRPALLAGQPPLAPLSERWTAVEGDAPAARSALRDVRVPALPWLSAGPAMAATSALGAAEAAPPAALSHVAWADRWLARFAGAGTQSLDMIAAAGAAAPSARLQALASAAPGAVFVAPEFLRGDLSADGALAEATGARAIAGGGAAVFTAATPAASVPVAAAAPSRTAPPELQRFADDAETPDDVFAAISAAASRGRASARAGAPAGAAPSGSARWRASPRRPPRRTQRPLPHTRRRLRRKRRRPPRGLLPCRAVAGPVRAIWRCAAPGRGPCSRIWSRTEPRARRGPGCPPSSRPRRSRRRCAMS